MTVLGIYGSPRKRGNTDRLLDTVLEGAAETGAETLRVYCRRLKVPGCLECGACDDTGECAVRDDMDQVYPLLKSADAIILAVPVFFYGMPAQAKALVDRSQACWNERNLRKPRQDWSNYESGKGYLLATGATRGKKLFEPTELTARYFFDALDMSYEESLLLRGLERKKDLDAQPGLLDLAYDVGKRVGAGL